MALPWEAGGPGLAPWDEGRTWVQDGVTWTYYADPASPSGWVLKRQDANGVSFQTGPTPNDPYAPIRAWEESPYGQRLARAEEAQAAQNAWQRGMTEDQFNLSREIQRGQLDVSRASQQATAEYQRGLLENARAQIAATIRGQNLTAGNQALQLGASLRGPRDHFFYQDMAAATRSNPLVQGAVATWADATRTRPTGAGSWQGGDAERMTLQALLSDLGSGGVNSTGNAVTDQTQGGESGRSSLAAFDELFRNPHRTSANYLSTLNPTQLGLMQGAADYLGHDWDTFLSRYDNSRVKQGIAGSNLA